MRACFPSPARQFPLAPGGDRHNHFPAIGAGRRCDLVAQMAAAMVALMAAAMMMVH
jgi:hypothetical protein